MDKVYDLLCLQHTIVQVILATPNLQNTTQIWVSLASERSERDTYRGKNEKIGDVYLFICIYVWTYVYHFVL